MNGTESPPLMRESPSETNARRKSRTLGFKRPVLISSMPGFYQRAFVRKPDSHSIPFQPFCRLPSECIPDKSCEHNFQSLDRERTCVFDDGFLCFGPRCVVPRCVQELMPFICESKNDEVS